jgi:hypothetical protein
LFIFIGSDAMLVAIKTNHLRVTAAVSDEEKPSVFGVQNKKRDELVFEFHSVLFACLQFFQRNVNSAKAFRNLCIADRGEIDACVSL